MRSTENDKNDEGMKLTINETNNIFASHDESLNVKSGVSVSVSNAYHMSEINQNDGVITTAKRMLWCGFSIICVGIICAITGRIEASNITVIAGIISEFISAIIYIFVSMSNKSKHKYFEQLSLSEEGEGLMKAVLQLDNKKAQEKQFDKMVTNYCERRKK